MVNDYEYSAAPSGPQRATSNVVSTKAPITSLTYNPIGLSYITFPP